jgi:hypothetical protein
MRRGQSVLLIVALLGLATMLSACESFDMDKLDFFNLNEKKKIPGDRKPVFPEGVPGVSQGVPPELIKGYQPPPEAAQAPPVADPKAAAVAEKPKPKRNPKPRVVARPTQVTVQPAAQGPQPQGAPAPWPSSAQQPSPWPTSPSPGTFQR